MEEYKDYIYDNSQISIGKYEILFRNHPIYNPISKDDVGDNRAIQYLNNANVYIADQLKYEIVNNPQTKAIECVRFTMPIDDAKLSYVFENLPWGIIKKNRTGIGATTLELNSPRHSIIVVPTRALAYEKAKSSRIGDTNKYKVLYIGGRIDGFNIPTIQDYLTDEEITYKKFIVVVDSLYKLLEEIGKDNYKDYFFMIDEIDSYQYDSWYRPNMEKAIDYYFKFPYQNRCMVSATVGDFSNPMIKEEPVIEVAFNNPMPRNITLEPTNKVLRGTINKIIELSEAHPNEKILVALNLVKRGILPVILSLPEELQRECSVLCGEKNKIHIEEYYKEILSNQLPSRITFMSCTFFVGIDISERFHLISVADPAYPFTLLSTDKLQQIAGRCRHHDGLLSETIIYNTKCDFPDGDIDYQNLTKEIISDANLLVNLSDSMSSIRNKFPMVIKKYNELFINEIVDNSMKSYFGSSSVRLVRESNNELAIAYFNIDNIVIQVKMLHTLYSKVENLQKALAIEGNNVNLLPYKQEEYDITDEIRNSIEELGKDKDEEQREVIIEELREQETLEDRKRLAQARRNNATNKNGIFLEHFIELQNYVPFEELIKKLPNYDRPAEYKDFYNAVIFWALDRSHPIKVAWKELFIKNRTYKGYEITEKINALWNGILGLGDLSVRQAVPLARQYFVTLKRSSVREEHRILRKYKVVSLNPLGLIGPPVCVIPIHENLQRKIRL